jgi:hypothetical protein
MGEWRKLHNEELNNVCFSPIRHLIMTLKINESEIDIACSMHEKDEHYI